MNPLLFCNPHDVRTYLNAPFNALGKTLYSNGHALLIGPLVEGTPDYTNKNIENVASTVLKLAESQPLIPFHSLDIEMPELITCGRCNGGGKCKITVCPECGGDGEVDAETNYSTYYDLRCKSCSGEGTTRQVGGDADCGNCNGRGKAREGFVPKAKLNGQLFQAQYIDLIADEPDALVHIDNDVFGQKGPRLIFKVGDYVGCILGMTH